MEKFILLFRGSDVYESSQPPEALQILTVKMIDWVGDLIKNDKHVSSEKWQRSGKKVSGAMKIVDENPFGEAHEIIGGCTIILARDFDEAVIIAKACPILETHATIEIRAIQSV
ncbi:MAG: YciI family protein [Ferruginibacter sp.]